MNFKWAWHAQFLSHNLSILQNCLSFEDKQMILLPFAKILKGIKVTNFGHSYRIHILKVSEANEDLSYVEITYIQPFEIIVMRHFFVAAAKKYGSLI